MNYRPDIDGLRAASVLAVVAFHIDPLTLPGGFVGVDAFFVISGYLITAVILSGLRSGEFSLRNFYAGRIRRLLPASLVTIASVLSLSPFFLMGTPLSEVGASAAFSAGSLANVYFYSVAGYFDSDSITKPLLHMWSLGVEEQFYLVWPSLLLLLFGRQGAGRGRLTVFGVGGVVLIGIASFLGAEETLKETPDAAFYLPHLRGWEFSGGALVYFFRGRWSLLWLRQVAFFVGASLLLSSCFLLDESNVFPGEGALMPCLGTALILWAECPPYLGRLFNNRPAVFIGRISYSVYLVHWPLVVFYVNYTFDKLVVAEKIALMIVSLALGTLLWNFVEEPWRRPPRRERIVTGSKVVGLSLGASVLLMAVGAVVWAQADAAAGAQTESKSWIQALRQASSQSNTLTLRHSCYVANNESFSSSRCLRPHAELPNILVVGDSLSANLFSGMREYFDGRAHVDLAASPSCRPTAFTTKASKACASRNRVIFHEADLSAYDVVVLTGNFRKREALSGIQEAARLLGESGASRVVLMGPSIQYRRSVSEALARYRAESPDEIRRQLTRLIDDQGFVSDRKMRKEAKKSGIEYFSLLSLSCPDLRADACDHFVSDQSVPIARDKLHLSSASSKWIWGELEKRGALFASVD